MKDEIGDLLSAVFKDTGKKSDEYAAVINRSSKNTAQALDMIKKFNSTRGDLNEELRRQNEELKRLAEEMDVETIKLPDSYDLPQEAEEKEALAYTPKISDEEIIKAFDKLLPELTEKIIGQDMFLTRLIIAFKRPFVAGAAQNTALNNILVTGAQGTGKHSAVRLITEILNKKQVIASGEVFSVDMSLYPSQDEASIFLHDLYIALESKARVVVFDNAEKAHPALIMMLSSLIQEGKIMLNSRYVEQKGILVESSKALTKSAVSSFSVKNQYIIIVTEKSPVKMSEVFGTGFSAALGDICTTDEFTPEALAQIAEIRTLNLEQKAKTRLKFDVSFTEAFNEAVADSFNREEGVHAMIAYEDSVFRALSEYKLRSDGKCADKLLLDIQDGSIVALSPEAKAEEAAAPESGKTETVETAETNETNGGENEALIVDLSALMPQPNNDELDEVKKELNSIVGLSEVKEYILSLEDNFKVQARRKASGLKTENTSMHMIFTGNPGTGKTTMARIVAKYLKAIGILSGGQLVEVTRADLVGRYVGHTAPLTTSVIKSAYGGVLFIDEAYSLYRGENDSYGLEAIDTIVKCMEEYRDEMVFILAGYTKEMAIFLTANSGLKSRFPNIIRFPDYSGRELTKIAQQIAQSKGYTIEEKAIKPMTKYFNAVQESNARKAGNGRLARNKVEEAILNQAARIVDRPDESLEVLKKDDFNFYDMY